MTLAAAPLPSIKDLFQALIVPPLTGEVWFTRKDPGAAHRFYQRGSLALAAGIEAIQKAGGAATIRVWVPDYFCDEALAPLRGLGVHLRFYPIQGDLTPHWQCLEDLADRTDYPQVLVLVHYFGFPNALREAKEFCDRRGFVFLEDGAHVLAPCSGMGLGTLQIYSPRKVLAVPAGGVLVLPESLALFLDDCSRATSGKDTLGWLCRRLMQKVLVGLGIPWHRLWALADNDRLSSPPGAPPPPPDLCACDPYPLSLLRLAQGEIDTVGQTRRSNYHRLEMAIRGLGQARPFFPQLPPDCYPYVFPLWVEEGSEAVKTRLRGRGILASRWPTFPPEVIASKSEHRTALRIWERLLLLPVHQSLSSRQMNLMTESLRAAIVEIPSRIR
jgi:hypothetical protein